MSERTSSGWEMLPEVDDSAYPPGARPVDHDPGDAEQYAGGVTRDPWDDPTQADWPDGRLPLAASRRGQR